MSAKTSTLALPLSCRKLALGDLPEVTGGVEKRLKSTTSVSTAATISINSIYPNPDGGPGSPISGLLFDFSLAALSPISLEAIAIPSVG